jgi:hypothetical protein
VKRSEITHEFVEFVPAEVEEGKLYVSIPYATSVHLCACGCGNKVVTPISPAAWRLIYDGDSVSLYPSIGSWEFPCQSHYWIRRNRVEWSRQWSSREIEIGRRRDEGDLARYYDKPLTRSSSPGSSTPTPGRLGTSHRKWSARIRQLIRRNWVT